MLNEEVIWLRPFLSLQQCARCLSLLWVVALRREVAELLAARSTPFLATNSGKAFLTLLAKSQPRTNMPHFSLSPSYEQEPRSLITSHQPRRNSTTCRLVTLSPDGRTMHNLLHKNCIETCRLPEERGTRTELPDYVQEALSIDAPVELVCVEGETKQQRNDDTGRQEHLLCLYTQKGVYLIKFTVPMEGSTAAGGGVGEILSVTEPLERYLEVDPHTTVLRIRPAPRHVTLAPPGSFAVLTENKETCEYTILLHHADGSVTTPLQVGVEDVVMEEERFTDFCFGQSHGLSLLPAMSALLLKSSGDVLVASPLVFDRTVVSKTCLGEARDYLQNQTDTILDRSTAKWRQCRVALQYLSDIFVASENRNQFATANVLNLGNQSAAGWPIKVQGPILFHSSVDQGPSALVIESFGSSDVTAGFAIGKQRGCIDFAAFSPTSLLPRFAYETRNDAYELDDALFQLGAMIERVDLGSTSIESNVQILKDPIMESLLHYTTPTQVFTVSTNSMNVASRKLKGGSQREAVNTTAWTTLNSGDPIQGIIIPDDATLGHDLIVLLQSGERIPVDVTESKYLHEFETRFQAPLESESSSTSALTTAPFHTEVEPLVQKINSGLASMGRIVGSETSYKEITPDTLAVALRVKKRCDDTVVLPLLQLKKLVDQRRETIRTTLKNQKTQLKTVLKGVQDLKQGLSLIGEKMERAETNASLLSERSVTVLQAGRDLMPTITQAEYDYFQDMKRLSLKVTQMEKETQRAVESITVRCEAIKDQSNLALNNMEPGNAEKASILLKHQGKTLKTIRERVGMTKEKTKALADQHCSNKAAAQQ